MTGNNYKPMPTRSTAVFPIPAAGESMNATMRRNSIRQAYEGKRAIHKRATEAMPWKPAKNRLPLSIEVWCAIHWYNQNDTMQIAKMRGLSEADVYNAMDWIRERAKRMRVAS